MNRTFLLPKLALIICVLVLLTAGCTEKGEKSKTDDVAGLEGVNVADIIVRGDILRDKPPLTGELWIPLYQANGRFGCVFGPFGLHVNPDITPIYKLKSKTNFMHMKHYVRAKFGADYLLPIANIYWENEPQMVEKYRQQQYFYDGTIKTFFSTNEYQADVISWFDPVRRDIAGFIIDISGKCPTVIINPVRETTVHYGDKLEISVSDQLEPGKWQGQISCRNVKSTFTVKSSAEINRATEGIRLKLSPGRNEILIAVNSDIDISAAQSLDESIIWWHKTWNSGCWLDLPDEAAQKVWVRSMAYILYSHNDDGFGCSPPCGLSGAGWPFPFPFDSSCRHPLLLWTGQLETAKKWIEYYYSRIEGLKEYTRRLVNKKGIMMPHVFPYGPMQGYHDPNVPNQYYYPVYGSGHLVRMAVQTAVMANDPQWTEKYVKPLITQAALYYLNCLEKGDDGLWHLYLEPSIGIDESGLMNQRDYLCGLVSAKYVLKKAVEYGIDTNNRAESVLKDGLAFKSLLSEEGMYYSHAGKPDFDKQKHPGQIFSLVVIPSDSQPDPATQKAHKLRYDLAAGSKEPRFAGHTGGQFILASARSQDANEWLKDWNNFQPANYADPDWTQFFESSGGMSFYTTTHGLVAQAILETVVSTWWGKLDLAPCVPWQGKVRFGNIRTLLGVTVSGQVNDGKGTAILTAWKDTSFEYRGQIIKMKNGEQKVLNFENAL